MERRARSRNRAWLASRAALSTLTSASKKRKPERRSAAAGCDLGMMEIRVAAMEEPAVRHPDRDAAMAARVTWKRDQQHLVARPGNRAHRREAEPSLAVRLDRRPCLDGGDLHGAITSSLPKARRVRRGAKLGCENVDRRAGKSPMPPAWSRSRWVGTMWRTSSERKPRSATCRSAVSATSSRGRVIALNRNPSRLESLTSSTPSPVSTRISRSSPSIKRQWQHIGAGDSGPPAPPSILPPRGHSDPQLR